MSFGVGLGDLVSVIKLCMEFYGKMKDAGDQIEDVDFRLRRVLGWVEPVEQHLRDTYPDGQYPQRDEIKIIVSAMRRNAKEIASIFKRYAAAEQEPIFFGFAQRVHFALGSSGKELERLITKIDQLAVNLKNQVDLNDITNKKQRTKQVTQQPLYGTVKQRNVKIIFVDPGNCGRSVVAHGYALLLEQWTRRANQPWFITNVHSAGYQIRKLQGLAAQQDQLKFDTLQAGRMPDAPAMQSLFDNKLFNYPYKQTVQEQIRSRPCHGVPNNMFRDFDYIFVFTFLHHTEVQKLKQLTRKTLGEAFAPRDKARIVMLGEYRSATSCEIFGPRKLNGKEASLADWQKCTSMIKLAFKGWLKEELDWKQPPPEHGHQ